MLDKIMSFRAVGWLVAHWQLALAIVSALMISHSAVYFIGRGHGSDSAMIDVVKGANAANDLATTSAGQAAAEGEIEEGRIANEKEMTDEAIRNSNTGDIAPSVASDALNCQRLRRSGQDLDRFPACRPGTD